MAVEFTHFSGHGHKDNYQVGGVYNGGYTYLAVDGSAGQTNYIFVQPRTVYLQLQKNVGP